MKTKWYVFGLVAFFLGVTIALSAAFQPGKKEIQDKVIVEKAPVLKSKDAAPAPKLDTSAQVFLPDSVLEKFRKIEELKGEVKSATAVTASKVKDQKAENDELLKQVVKLESLVQKSPFVEPLPAKVAAAPAPGKTPDSTLTKPAQRKRSFFNRLFNRK